MRICWERVDWKHLQLIIYSLSIITRFLATILIKYSSTSNFKFCNKINMKFLKNFFEFNHVPNLSLNYKWLLEDWIGCFFIFVNKNITRRLFLVIDFILYYSKKTKLEHSQWYSWMILTPQHCIFINSFNSVQLW